MKVLNEKGVATHFDPESCVARREVRGEALTGELAGIVYKPRKLLFPGAQGFKSSEGNTRGPLSRGQLGRAGYETIHVGKAHFENWEISAEGRADGARAREGNP